LIQKAGKLGKYEREAECRSDRSRILKSVLSNERVGRTRDEDGAKQQVEQWREDYSVGVGDGAEDLQLLLKSGCRLLLAFPRHHPSMPLTGAHTTGLATRPGSALPNGGRRETGREKL